MYIRLFIFIGSLFFTALLHAAALQQVSASLLDEAGPQLRLQFSADVQPHIFVLHDPERIVIDLPSTALHTDVGVVDLQGMPIDAMRSAKQGDGTLRVVLDLAGATEFVTLQTPTSIEPVLILQFEQSEMVEINVNQAAVPVRSADSRDLRELVIVLDPGHGGRDPGAIGPQGTQEKNVVLAVARQLQILIDQEPGMRAVLTRDDDYSIDLRERLSIARSHDADLFVSIHADAFKKSSAHGASVFALSQGGATSEAARWLAEKENYSELGGANLSDVEDEVVRSVLLDLSQTATIGTSLVLGDQVLSELGGVAKLHSQRVEQAGFVVLKSPDIPSILVETGFISNPTEELNLGSRTYRQQLAKALHAGIKRYLWEQAPDDSYIHAWRHINQYEVASGDNLSTIAQQHRVAVESLKALNNLDQDVIYIGQKLHIPERAA